MPDSGSKRRLAVNILTITEFMEATFYFYAAAHNIVQYKTTTLPQKAYKKPLFCLTPLPFFSMTMKKDSR